MKQSLKPSKELEKWTNWNDWLSKKWVVSGSRLCMGVSKNSGTPKSSILIGFSIINHPFWGPTPIFGNTNMYINFGTMSIQLMVDSWPGFFVVALGFDHGTPEIIVPFKEDPIIQQKMVASWTSRGQSKQNHFVTKNESSHMHESIDRVSMAPKASNLQQRQSWREWLACWDVPGWVGDRIQGLFHLLVNGVYIGVTTHLYTNLWS